MALSREVSVRATVAVLSHFEVARMRAPSSDSRFSREGETGRSVESMAMPYFSRCSRARDDRNCSGLSSEQADSPLSVNQMR